MIKISMPTIDCDDMMNIALCFLFVLFTGAYEDEHTAKHYRMLVAMMCYIFRCQGKIFSDILLLYIRNKPKMAKNILYIVLDTDLIQSQTLEACIQMKYMLRITDRRWRSAIRPLWFPVQQLLFDTFDKSPSVEGIVGVSVKSLYEPENTAADVI